MLAAVLLSLVMPTNPIEQAVHALPMLPASPAKGDWLVKTTGAEAGVYRTGKPNEIVLSNGLVARRFRLSPNAATVGLDNLVTGESLLRAVSPEALLALNGKEFAVGGLLGQPNLAFLKPAWLDTMKADPNAFRFIGFTVGKTEKRFDWKRVRHAANLPWPAPGASLTLHFAAPSTVGERVIADVRYELYDGIPLLAKQVSLSNGSAKPIRVDKFSAEKLRVVEAESTVDEASGWRPSHLFATTDYTFAGMALSASNQAARWVSDPEYRTQVNYNLKTPCVLDCSSPVGPEIDVAPGDTFSTFRVFELVHDDSDRERQGLAVRRMFRTLAPWCTENPIMLHLTSTDPKVVLTAIDQAASCGFEMVIISFWSGLDMEDQSEANFAKFKGFRDYAKAKGLELGGYSLLASRSVSPEVDVISPKTGKPGDAVFGSSPCLCSDWGAEYFRKIANFFERTGFDLLEHDGSYPGDVCASTKHSGHAGLGDSQWKQFQKITDLYHAFRAKGIYLNVPDNYFLQGSNKTGMGYRESNWSLPREQQHIHARQNLFDGTWEKTPTMGWMMTPLVEYQGGGKEATIEPLKDHLMDYEQHLANNFGYGAQSCYRGPRLYDAPQTMAVVQKWVNWFKTYRDILESDVIHVKRADGVTLDVALHVNPSLPIKGLAMVYNPSGQPLEQEIVLPLYYTGITRSARVAEGSFVKTQKHANDPKEVSRGSFTVDRDFRIRLKVKVEPYGRAWLVIR
ncbi:MAG: alpha-galactosidase [Armatimonadetes bacterium]|nr:alpha-galactosidase [Armatimonadota bacterium]